MRVLICAGVVTAGLLGPLSAQEAPTDGQLYVQLSNAQTMADTCQLTFAMRNDTGTAIDKSAYNMAVINTDQQVTTLITFEFRPLGAGQTKVQQFALPGQTCEQIAGLLINDFVTCDTPDGPSTVCEAGIDQSTRTNIAFPWELGIN